MPGRALVEHRPWLMASLIAAIAFYALRDDPLGGAYLMAIKGAAVGFLALYALRRAPGPDGRILALVMAIAAAGDIGVELTFEAGGALFLLSHMVAVLLYARNRRGHPEPTQLALAATLLVATPAIAWWLTADLAVTLYALVLGTMAAAAWCSRFTRYRVGAGAILFVASDLLIFAGMSYAPGNPVGYWLIWPLYYFGQFLIATGVVQQLRADHQS